jgi:hypothetical protein
VGGEVGNVLRALRVGKTRRHGREARRKGGVKNRDLTRGRQIKTRDVMTVDCMVFLHDRSLECQVYPSLVERG